MKCRKERTGFWQNAQENPCKITVANCKAERYNVRKSENEENNMKWFRKHKILTAFLLILLLLVGTVAGFIWSKLRLIQYDDGKLKETVPAVVESIPDETEAAVETEPEQIVDISGLEMVKTPPKIPAHKLEEHDDVINILVLGTDDYGGRLTDAARSDAMILVSINKTEKTVKLVSLERGMGVPVLEGEYEGQYDWLTHIFRYGGSNLVCRTVEHCFGVEIDNYVRVTFNTVRTVVDSIGGIHVYLSEAEASHLSSHFEEKEMYAFANLQEGSNYLNGEAALQFARLRSIDSDWQRVGRQRRVILAAVEALKGASLKQLNDLLDTTLPLIQTDMSMLEIAELMLYAPSFLESEFDQMTIPKQGTFGGMVGMGGRSLFAVDFEVNSEILKEFLYGDGE